MPCHGARHRLRRAGAPRPPSVRSDSLRTASSASRGYPLGVVAEGVEGLQRGTGSILSRVPVRQAGRSCHSDSDCFRWQLQPGFGRDRAGCGHSVRALVGPNDQAAQRGGGARTASGTWAVLCHWAPGAQRQPEPDGRHQARARRQVRHSPEAQGRRAPGPEGSWWPGPTTARGPCDARSRPRAPRTRRPPRARPG